MNTSHTSNAAATGSIEKMNPWLGIFFRPIAALRFAWQQFPEDFIHRIYIVSGFFAALGMRLPDWLNIEPHPIGVMIQMLLFAPIGGIVAMYVFAAVLRFFGRLLGQPVDSNRSKVMIAWTNLPFVLAWIIFILAYFTLEMAGFSPKLNGIWLFKGFIGYLPILLAAPFWIWAIVVRIKGITWLFGFSNPKSLLVWLLTVLFSYVPAIMITIVYFVIFFVTSASSGSN